MELNLAGKTAIVTGGSTNVGRGIVLAFAREGMNTVIVDIDEEQGTRVRTEAERLGGRSLVLKTDVTDLVSVSDAARVTIQNFGRIDVLVNNVGYSIPRLFREMDRNLMENIVELNLWTVFNCTQVVIDHMIERKYGKIINISSDAALVGGLGLSVYSAAKAGVNAFSKAMARELGRHGINVNVISLSTTLPENLEDLSDRSLWKGLVSSPLFQKYLDRETKATPLGRIGRPTDVGHAAVFLASDASRFITGQTLCVNGGWFML